MHSKGGRVRERRFHLGTTSCTGLCPHCQQCGVRRGAGTDEIEPHPRPVCLLLILLRCVSEMANSEPGSIVSPTIPSSVFRLAALNVLAINVPVVADPRNSGVVGPAANRRASTPHLRVEPVMHLREELNEH